MVDYDLNSDEVVIIECENVLLDDGKFVNTQGALILTNQNVIWLTKNLFGKVKNIQKYSLSDIKIYDDKAQVKVEEKIGEYTKLSLFFTNCQVKYRLTEKQKARELANNINKLVTGSESDLIAKNAIPGVAFVAETLKGTVTTFKNSIGIKAKQPEQITINCTGCGAPVSGFKGKMVKCPYCDTNVELK